MKSAGLVVNISSELYNFIRFITRGSYKISYISNKDIILNLSSAVQFSCCLANSRHLDFIAAVSICLRDCSNHFKLKSSSFRKKNSKMWSKLYILTHKQRYTLTNTQKNAHTYLYINVRFFLIAIFYTPLMMHP